MLKKIISLSITILLLFGNAIATQAGERPEDAAKRIAKAKAEVAKLGTGNKAGVKVKLLSGVELKGHVVENKEDEFTVDDPKTGTPTAIRYQDVAKVKKWKQDGGAKVPKGLIIGGVAAGAAVLSFIILRPRFKFGDLGIKFPPCFPNCPPTS
jgi:hypothetical protein